MKDTIPVIQLIAGLVTQQTTGIRILIMETTNFPLTGAHLSISCQDCHASGYQGTPTECVACHQTNYNNTTNPDHEALMLPTNCESCHSTNPDWQPATISYSQSVL